MDEAYRFGRLALKLYDKYKTEVWLCRTSVAFYGCVYNFKYPVDTAIEPLRRAYRLGLGTGDFEYAMLNGKILVRITAEITRLPELERQARDLLSEMDYLDQTLSRSTLTPVVQLILNLMGKADGDPKLLQGEVVDGDIERAKRGINPCMLDWVDYYSMKLAYLFSDYDLAEKHIATTRNLYRHIYASFESADIPFYESLVLLAQARNRKKGFLRRRLYLSQARKCLKIISNFALHSPLNFLGKQYLIQAEFAVVTGNHENAMSNFRSSVLHSRESGSLMMTALANERMGKYLLERGELEMHDRCWRRHTSIMGNGAPWPK